MTAMLAAAVALAGSAPAVARAQVPGAPRPPIAVRGLAYDSVGGQPLADAFITLDGTRNATTDARGHFRFDSVPSGTHVLAMQHAALDSLGFSGIAVRVAITDRDDEVRVATPSLATLWRAACRRAGPPKDSGFVFGTVTDAATGHPARGAVVGLTWLSLDVDRARKVSMQQFAGAGRADADGAYVICGVPIGTGLRMQASADSADSGVIDLVATTRPVQRRDLVVGPPAAPLGSERGTIVGRVTDASGAPVPNARIVTDGAEARTDSGGRFVVRGVRPGSQQVEALAIGMSPVAGVVAVRGGDTASFSARLHKVTTLDVVRVTASSRGRRNFQGVEERRRSGLGYVRDSSTFNPHGLLSTVFDQFPATRVQRSKTGGTRFSLLMKNGRGEYCPALVFLDGVLIDPEFINDIRPEELAVIEAYPHGTFVPAEFTSVTARRDPCGAAVLWTRHAFR